MPLVLCFDDARREDQHREDQRRASQAEAGKRQGDTLGI